MMDFGAGRVCSHHGVITMSSEQQRGLYVVTSCISSQRYIDVIYDLLCPSKELNEIIAEGGVRYTCTGNRTVPLPLQDPNSICKHGAVKKNCRNMY